ncbi:hypothetical protein JTE90_010287 [Oedothorax gibbosus]|uniref:Uncharacterized protein n=1 Tax=Oedothorax gibbosus TaxID=931172 RepID=A0AAV6V489_9ARAC|nr:hypothetical protein JTE90_010287 [Oedothorax gibbosus]
MLETTRQSLIRQFLLLTQCNHIIQAEEPAVPVTLSCPVAQEKKGQLGRKGNQLFLECMVVKWFGNARWFETDDLGEGYLVEKPFPQKRAHLVCQQRHKSRANRKVPTQGQPKMPTADIQLPGGSTMGIIIRYATDDTGKTVNPSRGHAK